MKQRRSWHHATNQSSESRRVKSAIQALGSRHVTSSIRLSRKQRTSAHLKEHQKLNRGFTKHWQELQILLSASPPAPISLVLTEQAVQDLWLEHLARWSYYYEPIRVARIANALVKRKSVTPAEEEYLKHLKNAGDDLRTFCRLFSVLHETPRPIQLLVKKVGQIRDCVRLGRTKRTKEHGRELLKLMGKVGEIRWPALRPSPARVRRCLLERITEIKQRLVYSQMTGKEFHGLKKDFRLLFTVYYSLEPEKAQLPVQENPFLAIKQTIKKMHQLLLERKVKEGLKYRSALLTLPEEFAITLKLFVGSIRVRVRQG
jgi:hypothetical protein